MVIVSALPTDELLSVGLGQLMAARAFLRGVRRVCFDYHYAAQSGLVQNELEQLIERPLRLFGVAANLSLSNVLQFFPAQCTDDVLRRSPRFVWTPRDFRTLCVCIRSEERRVGKECR